MKREHFLRVVESREDPEPPGKRVTGEGGERTGPDRLDQPTADQPE
jgi:hypothetical protein